MKKLFLILAMLFSILATQLIQASDMKRSANENITEEQKMNLDTSRSDKIVQNYRDSETKFVRKSQTFSGTWEATPEELFPLFCPAREADWIPGWDCQLIYTESGFAEDKVVFMTDKSNPSGEGLWTFTGYKLNNSVEFVKYQQDVLTHAKITVTDNNDGTSTATWDVVLTALSEKGNEIVGRLGDDGKSHHAPIVQLIEHYLKKGKIDKLNP